MTETTFQCGDIVTWRSSNTDKIGRVVATIPAGDTPADAGLHGGGGGLPRDHMSYVIRGGEPCVGARINTYWPRASLLSPAGTIDRKVLARCPAKLRALIDGSAKP